MLSSECLPFSHWMPLNIQESLKRFGLKSMGNLKSQQDGGGGRELSFTSSAMGFFIWAAYEAWYGACYSLDWSVVSRCGGFFYLLELVVTLVGALGDWGGWGFACCFRCSDSAGGRCLLQQGDFSLPLVRRWVLRVLAAEFQLPILEHLLGAIFAPWRPPPLSQSFRTAWGYGGWKPTSPPRNSWLVPFLRRGDFFPL